MPDPIPVELLPADVWAELDRAMQGADDSTAGTRQAFDVLLKLLGAKRGHLVTYEELSRRLLDLEADLRATRAQRGRYQAVVDAAREWLAQRRSPEAFQRQPRAELIRLADAVDALDKELGDG